MPEQQFRDLEIPLEGYTPERCLAAVIAKIYLCPCL
jgi:hypothetical protein